MNLFFFVDKISTMVNNKKKERRVKMIHRKALRIAPPPTNII